MTCGCQLRILRPFHLAQRHQRTKTRTQGCFRIRSTWSPLTTTTAPSTTCCHAAPVALAVMAKTSERRRRVHNSNKAPTENYHSATIALPWNHRSVSSTSQKRRHGATTAPPPTVRAERVKERHRSRGKKVKGRSQGRRKENENRLATEKLKEIR